MLYKLFVLSYLKVGKQIKNRDRDELNDTNNYLQKKV